MSKIRKFNNHHDQEIRPPYRKVFMITEKSTVDDETTPRNANTNSVKRKMLLILDEAPKQEQQQQQQQQQTENKNENQQKYLNKNNSIKIKSEQTDEVAPKLLLFANNVDNQISQKIESLLPEILNRFQWKNGRMLDFNEGNNNSNSNSNSKTNSCSSNKTTKQQQQHTPTNLTYAKQISSNQQLYQKTNSESNYEEILNNLKNENANNNANLMLLGAAAAAATASYTKTSNNNNNNQTAAADVRKITLPPKKNHSKLQKQLNNHHHSNSNSNNLKLIDPNTNTNTSNSSNNSSNSSLITNSNNDKSHFTNLNEVISAATPVIVSTTSLKGKVYNHQQHQQSLYVHNADALLKKPCNHQQQQSYQSLSLPLQNGGSSSSNIHFCHNGNSNKYNSNTNTNSNTHNHHHNDHLNNSCSSSNSNSNSKDALENSITVQQQNINLTGDFLFLMKMLPILEKTPEPRKSQVKLLIEKIMKQCGGNVSAGDGAGASESSSGGDNNLTFDE